MRRPCFAPSLRRARSDVRPWQQGDHEECEAVAGWRVRRVLLHEFLDAQHSDCGRLWMTWRGDVAVRPAVVAAVVVLAEELRSNPPPQLLEPLTVTIHQNNHKCVTSQTSGAAAD